MLPLADMQERFVDALLRGRTPDGLFAGPLGHAALDIHRNTVRGVLIQALRLSYPTVDALVGADFFDQTAHLYIAAHPPRAACLTFYGDAFADFLAGAAAALPYLPDVARLDRAVEKALHAPSRRRRFPLDDAVAIDLPVSLTVVPLAYAADAIRAALGDDAALAAIDMRPAACCVLVWRKGDAAAVTRVDPAAGRFLAALLDGQAAGAALQAAGPDALHAIQTDIFAASFCTVISHP